MGGARRNDQTDTLTHEVSGRKKLLLITQIQMKFIVQVIFQKIELLEKLRARRWSDGRNQNTRCLLW